MKFFFRLLSIVLLTFLLVKCARQGNPEGGPKDETPPVMVTAKPPYKTTNFKKSEIRIHFDEYIVLRGLSKQLVVSPPFKNLPDITPQGTPSKYIKIKILDTLRPNTTYTLDFGSSVQDNNEGNKLESLKYVFSTGNFIDSLKVKGTVVSSSTGELRKNVSVLLYKLDSTYNDSVPFKEKPYYVTSTLDSLNYQFKNIQEGMYTIIALDEGTKDYIYNPKTDKVGFLLDTIRLPKDSIISKPISIFKEEQPYAFKRGKEVSKGKIKFGFEGDRKKFNIKLLSEVPPEFKSFQEFETNSDTLNYWFTPIVKDSLKFTTLKKGVLDTIKIRLRKKKIDSLYVSSTVGTVLHLTDTLFLITNNPIINVDKTKTSLFDKDTVEVDYQLKKQNPNKLALLFKKEPNNKYKFTVLPKAITDLYETTNDTLKYNFTTKDPEDYGSISLKIENKTEKPLIIQLLLNGNRIIKTKFIKTSKKIDFSSLQPGEYSVRAIIDDNDNKVWNTGSLLKKTQPERIVYYEEKMKLRANWIIDNTFVVE